MNEAYKKFRRESGMARFENGCRLVVEDGILKKAWRVPGTREAGVWNMYRAEYRRSQRKATA